MIRRIALFAMLIMLTACGTSPEKAMYEHMEKAVILEEVFAANQQPLVDAEKKEFALFEDIISLGISEKEEIKALSDEALSIVNLRKSLIEQENESIEAGYIQFQKVALEIPKLKNKEAKELVEDVMEAMNRRYDTYQQLKVAYEHSITLDKKLYEMFQEDEVTIAELQAQIDEINEMYLKVKELKEQFNDETKTFNDLKKAFYQSTNLNIAYEQ
ncbi:MAG TPA: hypothetical protein GX525_10035 [Bacilli bacterium]|nr:hypothetical protein [Bacilli bacterium]